MSSQPSVTGGSPTRRRRGGPADLVRSLVLVLLVVGVIIVITPRSGGDALRVADFRAALQTAQLSATYDVVAPGPLPEGWRTVQAQTERDGETVVWRVGLRTPADEFVTIEQSTDGDGPLLGAVSTRAQQAGEAELAGRTWHRFTEGPTRDLVLPGSGSSVLLTGDVPWVALELVATGLHTAGGASTS